MPTDYEATRQQIRDLAASHGVAMTAEPTTREGDDQWNKEAGHYACAFTAESAKPRTVTYSVGPGILAGWADENKRLPIFATLRGQIPDDWAMALRGNKSLYHTAIREQIYKIARDKFRPDIADVLSSLVSDASGTDQPFTDWCADYGYSDDSRKAEAMYRECQETMFWLRAAFREDMEKLQDMSGRL